MRRYSVTEIEFWEECRYRWEQRYVKKYYQPEGKKGAALMSGIAIAEGLEAGILAGGMLPIAQHRAEEWLLEHDGERFVRGAKEALKAVPQWIWDMKYGIPEDKLEPVYADHTDGQWHSVTEFSEGDDYIKLVGRPDLWSANEDTLLVVEFKSTSAAKSKAKQKIDGYNWAVQPYAYAFMLKDTYPELEHLTTYVQHVLVTTRGELFEGPKKLIGAKAMQQWRNDVLTNADQIGKIENNRHFGVLCGYCEFQDACAVYRAGQDPQPIIDMNFKRRT